MTRTLVTAGELELRPGDGVAFWSVEVRPDEAEPADLVLVLDASGSLAGPPRTRAAAALATLVASLPQERRVSLVLATQPPRVVAPLAPLARTRAAIEAALAKAPAGGAATLARALDLAGLEVAREPRPATVVLVSDLAWGPADTEALARLDARGAGLLLVLATSAFTPPAPARTPRLAIPLAPENAERAGADDTAPLEVARALADLVQAGASPPAEGWLEVELAKAPAAWFSGEPLEPCAPGAVASARVPLERGAARLAFATRDRADSPGEARLVLAGEATPRRVALARAQASVLERAPVLAPVGATLGAPS